MTTGNLPSDAPTSVLSPRRDDRTPTWRRALASLVAVSRRRVCLGFPDMYDIGMSHLGYKILYGLINAHPRSSPSARTPLGPTWRPKLRARACRSLSLESRAAAARLRRGGLLAAVRAHLHEHPARCSTWAASRSARTIARTRPAGDRGRPHGHAPRAHRAVHRRVRHRRRRARCPRSLLTWAACVTRGCRAAERLIALAKLGGVYVPELYETAALPRHRASTWWSPVDPDAPFPVERAFVDDLALSPSRTTGPSAAPRPSSTACPSRSRAAAPRAAASARPA
jgi:hypothetical protein